MPGDNYSGELKSRVGKYLLLLQLGTNRTEYGDFKYLMQPVVSKVDPNTLQTEASKRTRRLIHPCLLRMNDASAIVVNSPLSLVSAGYASLAMGLFTLFRTTPFLLFVLAYRFKKVNPNLIFNEVVLYVSLFTWSGIVLFVLFIFGIVLTASTKITKRWVLMLHPWGLLLLYLDVFVWISLIVYTHVDVIRYPDLSIFDCVYHPLVFFIIMYVECVIIGVLYYVYATYFIAAELTVIENFF